MEVDAAMGDMAGVSAGGRHLMSAPGETPTVDLILPFLLFSISLGIVSQWAGKVWPRAFPLPFTVTIFLLSGAFAAWAESAHGLSNLGASLKSWATEAHPHIILFVFLPPLLFESAVSLDYHVFLKVAGQSVLLALVGVFIAVALTACTIMGVMSSYDWNWSTSLLLGSILSATDPVAVVAVLHELGAPHKLATMIEGESLLNDGSAFVLFLIFKDLVVADGPGGTLEGGGHEAPTGGEMVGTFLQLSLGGPLFGLACAMLVYFTLKHIYDDAQIEISALLVSVYTTFFIAENALHVSGVLAVVTFGLFMARSGKYALSRRVELANHNVWGQVGWLCNTIIFCMAGITCYDRMVVASDVALDPLNWGLLFAMYFLLHVIRGAVIAMLFPLLSRMGYGLSWKEASIMTYGGLRGAVGLALGLMVERTEGIDVHVRSLVNFHVSGIVILTLIVNGSTAGKFYRWIKPYPVNKDKERLCLAAMEELNELAMQDLKKLKLTAENPGVVSLARRLIPDFHNMGFFDENGKLHVRQGSVQTVFSTHLRRTRFLALMKTAIIFGGAAAYARRTAARFADSADEEKGTTADAIQVKVDPPPTRERRSTSVASAVTDGSSGKIRAASSGQLDVQETTETDLSATRKMLNTIDSRSATGQKQLYLALFTMLKANYRTAYESTYIGNQALVALIDCSDAGMEAARKISDDSEDVPAHPFEVALAHLTATMEHGLVTRMETCLGRVAKVFEFQHIRFMFEALRAYTQAHKRVGDECVKMHGIASHFPKLVRQSGLRAKAQLKLLSDSHPGHAIVMQTLQPTQVALEAQLHKVQHLEEERGMLDESIAHDMIHIIEHRQYELSTFVPTVELLTALDKATKAVVETGVQRKKSMLMRAQTNPLQGRGAATKPLEIAGAIPVVDEGDDGESD